MRRHRLIRPIVLGTFLAVLLAACGEDAGPDAEQDDSEAAGAAIPEQVDLEGLEVTVGSKEFTEQLILGYVAMEALEAAGATVTDQVGLGGTGEVRTALEAGEIDLYWEYTGTGWITHLGETEPLPDAQEQYDAVAERDRQDNGIVWLEPAEPDNTYALAMSPESHEEYGTETVSDVAQLAEENPDAVSICGTDEFMVREDGLPGLEEHYGFEASATNEMDPGIMYSEVAQNPDDCRYAAVFATDGRIAVRDLVVMEDDESFFPVYQPSMNVDAEIYDEWQEELEQLNELVIADLDTETLQQMNAEVDEFGAQPREVAVTYLQENGLIP